MGNDAVRCRASINVPELRKLLRLVYNEQAAAKEKGKNARKTVQEQYTPGVVLDRMMELAQGACESRRREQREKRKAKERNSLRGRASELIW